MTDKRWKIRRIDTDVARSLAVSAGIPDLLATLLVARGIESESAAKSFLCPSLKESLRDPFLLPGCYGVASRLLDAVLSGKKIAIYGDYDVDGITGTVILRQILKDIGGKVIYHIPSRLDEGYGLHDDAIKRLVIDDGAEVIVTVDCGIASVKEAETVIQLGAELLITDHHAIGINLPNAAAIAHPQLKYSQVKTPANSHSPYPNQPDSKPNNTENPNADNYPFTELCGAAVALKVAWGVCQLAAEGPGSKVSAKFRDRLVEMVGFAALGTVADFVRLIDENRVIVHSGLRYLAAPSSSAGMKKLLAICNFSPDRTDLNSEFAAFQIVPRLNAAGRLGQAMLAVELLTAEDESRVNELANYIDGLNESRKKLEREILKAAEQQIVDKSYESDAAFVLVGEDWHKGVLGIVASRLVDKYHRPTLIFSSPKMGFTSSETVGSARGVVGFDLYKAIKSCSELLIRFGGHAGAAGITLDKSKIDEFREVFCDYVETHIEQEERTAEIFVDGEFPLGAFSHKTVKQISQLAPFGNGNAKPIFIAKNVFVKNPKAMGKEEKKHFTADFTQNGVSLRGVAFNHSSWTETMQPYDQPMEIVFKAQISNYSGNVELDVIDWKRD
ncbi:MAG: DHH family phosphoesterase [Planctomycetaceae bacterium]|nr:DHH family phosphoesterase [Planctomycetaceae bacterium]